MHVGPVFILTVYAILIGCEGLFCTRSTDGWAVWMTGDGWGRKTYLWHRAQWHFEEAVLPRRRTGCPEYRALFLRIEEWKAMGAGRVDGISIMDGMMSEREHGQSPEETDRVRALRYC